jgi:sugar (pentulose or hexulose) kinase
MPDTERIKNAIEAGETYMGLEFGSTRIKAVLIDRSAAPIASGSPTWENRLEDGLWRDCYARLADDVKARYGVPLRKIGAIGFSGMMHGYMAFDQDGQQLVPFRTWRNTVTETAGKALTELFDFNIPQRWSIAHLYQAILNGEEHVSELSYLTTLAGYIHWKLTGVKAVGVGEASGMFPIDTVTGQYNRRMLGQFGKLIEGQYPWSLESVLPRVLQAGENAGFLTAEGAALLDPTGTLAAGIPVCPPEGDAGTGMVATNSVAARSGNISAGTSVFAMVVLEKDLSCVHPEIDIVTTPTGDPVAMVHCNNGTGDIDDWAALFGELSEAMGLRTDKNQLYGLLFQKALEADNDCGGLLAYSYFTGEPVTGLGDGRPLLVRRPDSRLTLANFMQALLFSPLCALKIGLELLLSGEGVGIDGITGHGGFFKVRGVGQKILAAALGLPVTVMQTAGEGGPWGMAVLAAYMTDRQPGETLAAVLENRVFKDAESVTQEPNPALAAAFDAYLARYKEGLGIERAAVEAV